jgi:hypothetical protein
MPHRELLIRGRLVKTLGVVARTLDGRIAVPGPDGERGIDLVDGVLSSGADREDD